MTDFTQWSSLAGILGVRPGWVPPEDQDRIAAYIKYDELYWNDPTQFSLRVLDGEEPLYIPNARVVVDTTSHYLLKGLNLKVPNPETSGKALRTALDALLDREMFYSRFHTAKHAGVARGDFAFHLTGNPLKAQGTRLSLTPLDPSSIFPVYDEDNPTKLIRCHVAEQYYLPNEPDKVRIRKLTYHLVEDGETRKVAREEAIYELEPKWYGPKPKLVRQVLPYAFLDPRITAIPIYWFKNIDWDGQDFGSSELRGFESLLRAVSQGSTDVQMALSLEGLGVYATDGGRPVNDQGQEVDWEVAPGRVMEVPSGSYFRRIEGVGSITPATDQIGYLEAKLREATSLSDVALGRVDVQTAQSGIALAIKFMPTLAKIDERDTAGLGRLKQLFFDWKTWHEVFEKEKLEGEIIPELGEKLPLNRTERVNELNNMLDRRVISTAYYREEMAKLGYVFPDDIQAQIDEEQRQKLIAAQMVAGSNTPPGDGSGDAGLPQGNRSNNRARPNESAGTESGQPLERQARGGKPR